MSVLASLVRAYDRLGDDVPPFGYSLEKIGFLISLNEDGTPAGLPIDLREGEGKKKTPRLMQVPASFKRPGTTPKSFFLWDNTAFALGVSADENKAGTERFEAFRERHVRDLGDSNDVGLRALLRFIESWRPEEFLRLGWPEDMKDQNVVFALNSEHRQRMIHDRPAARTLWAHILSQNDANEAVCLVTGKYGPIDRIHPPIRGIRTAGGGKDADSIVSFNKPAFESYGHEQGDNAPVSKDAAFKYTTVLNRYLGRDSGHRIQIGDASAVFWADAADAEATSEAEDIFASLFSVDENVETKKVAAILEAIRQGRPIADLKPDLPQGVRFFVLGLWPNAARLSVRFFIEDDFGEIATRYLLHVARMRIDPPPREGVPSIWRLLIESASQRKSENIPPNLAGEWLRSILTGAPYPLTLLSALLMRLRADHDINALRAAILKAVLVKNFELEVPVSLDPENKDSGYLLGRLFATYEYVQTQALGGNINATICDQYYGTASATPRAVFPLLQRKATHHLSRLRKDKPGFATKLDRKIGEIFELAEPESLFTPILSAQRQALFAIGYYHQRNDLYRRKDARAEPTIEE